MKIAAVHARCRRRAGRPANGGHASRATPTPGSGVRWRSRCGISQPTKALDILVDIARRLRRAGSRLPRGPGTSATGQEPALLRWAAYRAERQGDTASVDAAFTSIAWRLHVPAAVSDLTSRATSTTCPRRIDAGD